MNFEKHYRYTGKQKLGLTKLATAVDPEFEDEKVIKAQIAKNIKQLTELQGKLYAQDRFGVLVIFQAMDAAGKDSMIRHIMSGSTPKAVKSHRSSNQLLKKLRMIIYGEFMIGSPNAA